MLRKALMEGAIVTEKRKKTTPVLQANSKKLTLNIFESHESHIFFRPKSHSFYLSTPRTSLIFKVVANGVFSALRSKASYLDSFACIFSIIEQLETDMKCSTIQDMLIMLYNTLSHFKEQVVRSVSTKV